MPLQIKRGTNTQRLAYTPSQGELVFVTDYSTAGVGPLWIGTGDVGTPYAEVSGSGGGGLTELSEDTTPELGGNLDLAGFEITGIGDVDITGTISSTGTITSPAFVGDLKGSVFADDSSPIIDSVSGEIYANGNILHSGQANVVSTTTGSIATVNLKNTGDAQYLKFVRTDSGTAPNQNIGLIGFDQIDDGGTTTHASMAFWHGGIYIASSSTGSFAATNYMGLEDGNLCVGDYSAAAGYRLDVRGNAIVSGSLEAGAMLLSGSNIDTSDSSVITVTPAVTFNSDVTVENNLIVTNTLTVDTLEVTNFQTSGSGTPELASDTDILLTAGTRVEITQSPLKMASFTTTERNALTPQNGDVIYNTTDSKFQGYAGGTWVNLH
jgi:hypothetical protein